MIFRTFIASKFAFFSSAAVLSPFLLLLMILSTVLVAVLGVAFLAEVFLLAFLVTVFLPTFLVTVFLPALAIGLFLAGRGVSIFPNAFAICSVCFVSNLRLFDYRLQIFF